MPTNYLAQYNFGTPWGQQPAGLPPAPKATPGNIQGANPQTGVGPYGGLPQIPSPTATQKAAIGGNVGNLGSLYGLTGSLNTEIAGQAALPYNLNLPQYGQMIGQSSGNILDLLKGQVPQDVANQIAQMAAERGVSTGSIGSPNANTALLRALGLTSLGLQQQGEQELTGAIGRTPTGKQFDPTSFLVTPEQQQEASYLSNLMAAAPDPTAAAQASLTNALAGYGFGRTQAGQPSQPGFPILSSTPTPLGYGYTGGQAPLGGVNPPTTGGTAYSSSYTPMTGEEADYLYGPADYSNTGTLPQDWQTGMPLENYSPDIMGADLFGGGDYFGDFGG